MRRGQSYFKDKGLTVTKTLTEPPERHNHFCVVGGVYYPCPAPVDGTTLNINGFDIECSPELADYPTDSCPLCHESEYPLLCHLQPETISFLIAAAGTECNLSYDEMEKLQALGYVSDLTQWNKDSAYYSYKKTDLLDTVMAQYRAARQKGLMEAIYQTLENLRFTETEQGLFVVASDKDAKGESHEQK